MQVRYQLRHRPVHRFRGLSSVHRERFRGRDRGGDETSETRASAAPPALPQSEASDPSSGR